MSKRYIAYTDGGSNDKYEGGWAFYIPGELKRAGYKENTTNNEMELTAMIELLKYVGKDTPITVYCDSTYVVKGLTEWSVGWRKHNWIKSDGNPVANVELWKVLISLYNEENHKIEFVKGHSGIDGNEICDELVQKAKELKTESFEECLGSSLNKTQSESDSVYQKFQEASDAFNALSEYDKRLIASQLVSMLATINYQLSKY